MCTGSYFLAMIFTCSMASTITGKKPVWAAPSQVLSILVDRHLSFLIFLGIYYIGDVPHPSGCKHKIWLK